LGEEIEDSRKKRGGDDADSFRGKEKLYGGKIASCEEGGARKTVSVGGTQPGKQQFGESQERGKLLKRVKSVRGRAPRSKLTPTNSNPREKKYWEGANTDFLEKACSRGEGVTRRTTSGKKKERD